MLWVSDIEEFLLNEKLISDVENTEVKKEDTESKATEIVAENNEKKNKVEESTNNAKETENKEE